VSAALWTDARWLSASPGARALFALVAQFRSTTGLRVEPAHFVLFGLTRARGARAARELVAAGLLVEVEGGFEPVAGGPLVANDAEEPSAEDHVSTARSSSGPRSAADRTRAWRERRRAERDGAERHAVTGVTDETVTGDVTCDAGCDVTGDGVTSLSLSLLSSEDRKNSEEIERERDLRETESLLCSSPISSASDLSGHDRARGDAQKSNGVTPRDGKRSSVTASRLASQAREVFAWWASERGKIVRSPVAPKLDQKRARLIEARLREGYGTDRLRAAISGACATPFNRGENDQGKPYLDLGLILRDAEHIERFEAAAPRTVARPTQAREAEPPASPEDARRFARDALTALGDPVPPQLPSPPIDMANIERASAELFALANGEK
jgi:hypothetical protein